MSTFAGGDGLKKRFYKTADVAEVEDGWAVTLDGRRLRTPAQAALALPSQDMAAAVAAEWQFQSAQHIRPYTMPIFSLISTAVDVYAQPGHRERVVDALCQFLPADVACCRHEPDTPLAARQAERFDPLIAEANDAVPGLGLVASASLWGAEHSAFTTESAGEFLRSLGDLELAVFEELCRATRSFVISFALFTGRVGAAEAVELSRLEESAQIREWGLVEGGHDIDIADLEARLAACEAMLWLVRRAGAAARKDLVVGLQAEV
ncbi:unnamed protein product [Pedinophyceae sp. YPF-701]|nr:unnamed protein product [Pedinophyceae sp. YPF-701]